MLLNAEQLHALFNADMRAEVLNHESMYNATDDFADVGLGTRAIIVTNIVPDEKDVGDDVGNVAGVEVGCDVGVLVGFLVGALVGALVGEDLVEMPPVALSSRCITSSPLMTGMSTVFLALDVT